jgi:ABC-type transport system involved in multi-copper enzyme maturation permease subunit
MSPVLAFFIRMLREQMRDLGGLLGRLVIGLVLTAGLFIAELEATFRGAPGRFFFQVVMATNYLLVMLAALSVGSQAIAEEKEAGTLGLLRLTSLGPLSILLGKAGSNLVIVLLVVTMQIPFTLLAVTLGGVSVTEIFRAFALLASTTMALTALGLVFSVVLSKMWRAALMAFCVGLLILLSPVLLSMAAVRLDRTSYDKNSVTRDEVASRPGGPLAANERLADAAWRSAEWMRSVLPTTHLMHVLRAGYGRFEVARGIIAQCTFALACFGIAWWLFPRFCEDESKYSDSGKGPPLRQRLALFRLGRPGMSATFWKDFHFFLGGKAWFLTRLILYPLVIAYAVWLADNPTTTRLIAKRAWGLGTLILYFDAAVFVIRAWSPELRSRTLPQLMILPASLKRLHLEKLAAVAIAMLPSLVPVTVAILLGVETGFTAATPRGVLRIVSFTINSAFFLCLCYYLSLFLRWAALPAGAAIAALFYVLMYEYIVSPLIRFRVPLSRIGLTVYEVMQFTQIAIYGAITVTLFLLAQRRLHRAAAVL